jgi:putative transposase
MLEILISLFRSLGVWFRSNAKVQLQIVAFRHQLAVSHRQHPKPAISKADRFFWVWLSRFWPDWRSALLIVKPATVIAWHRVLDLEHPAWPIGTSEYSKGNSRPDPHHVS